MKTYPVKPEKVYFFGTCLIDSVYPGTGMAAIELIRREGIQVIFPQGQSCCGQPAYNSGFPDEARAVARRQLDLFGKDYPIVVPSGSCAGMMKHHYPDLFARDRDREKAERFAGRVSRDGSLPLSRSIRGHRWPLQAVSTQDVSVPPHSNVPNAGKALVFGRVQVHRIGKRLGCRGRRKDLESRALSGSRDVRLTV